MHVYAALRAERGRIVRTRIVQVRTASLLPGATVPARA